MNRPLRRAGAIVIALFLLSPSPTPAQSGPATVAAQYLAGRLGGSPADFALLTAGQGRVPVAGDAVWFGKFRSRSTGDIAAVYVDASGTAFGPAEFQRREARAEASLPALERKADPGLHSYLAANQPAAGSLLPVEIWIAADAGPAVAGVRARFQGVAWTSDRPTSADPAVARAVRDALYQAKEAVYGGVERSLAAAVVRLGGRPGYGSTSVPLLFADLPAGALDDLAALPEVVDVGLDAGGWSGALAYAGPTVQADWAVTSADQGNGARVAVVEYNNVRGSGDLSGKVVASHSTTGTIAYVASGSFDHPTWVAGAIASQNSTYRGIAPGALIVSSSTGGYSPGLTNDQAIISAADWAINSAGGDADIVSTSIVQDTSTGSEEARKYFDAISFEHGRLSVSASGNYGLGAYGGWYVGSPGLGWNVLTVGGTDDANTSSWSDDKIWYDPVNLKGSSYRELTGTSYNPHGDFNKPNVSAPAVTVRTANSLSASGTSVATPIVSGIAAQLEARDANLLTWPQVTRALIMAGAIHHSPMPGTTTISPDHEGVGTVSAKWANSSLVHGDGTYGGYDFGSMTSSASFTRTFSVAAGQHVRVALAWDSHTSGSNLSKADSLTADLDVGVTFPDGVTKTSASFDNSYEAIEYTPTASGTATIRVSAPRFDSTFEHWGLAWKKWTSITTSPPTVKSFASTTPSPTNATTLGYGLTFSEAVSGLAPTDFTVGGSSTGWSVTSISGSGASYTINLAATSPPSGTVVLSLDPNAVINQSGNLGPSSSVTAPTVTVDGTTPTVSLALQPASDTGASASDDLTDAATLSYSVTFGESVTGVSASDFALGSGTATGCSLGTPAGSGATYTLAVGGCSPGTVVLTFLAGGATDLAGNTGPAANDSAPTVTIDRTPPTLTGGGASPASPTNSTALAFTISGGEELDCATLTSADFDVANGTFASAARTSSGTCTVGIKSSVLAGAIGTTSVGVSGAFSAADLAGNAATTAGGFPLTWTVDRATPTVSTPRISPSNSAVGASLTVTATAHDAGNVAAAEIRIGGGAWTPMSASDGAFGGPTEGLTASPTAPLVAGSYSACVRVTDTAGNASAGTDCATFTVGSPKSTAVLSYTGTQSAVRGAPISLSATLETAGGTPIAGATVTFKVSRKSYSAVTDSSGNAVVGASVTAPNKAGSTTITISFAGGTSESSLTTTASLIVL